MEPRLFMWAFAMVASGSVLPPARGTTLYLAPDGDDRWPGSRARPDAGRTDGPLASLRGARDRLRGRRAKAPLAGPVRVVVGDGMYPIAEPVDFEPQDSGTAQAPLVFEAAPGARPVGGMSRGSVGFAEMQMSCDLVRGGSRWRRSDFGSRGA